MAKYLSVVRSMRIRAMLQDPTQSLPSSTWTILGKTLEARAGGRAVMIYSNRDYDGGTDAQRVLCLDTSVFPTGGRFNLDISHGSSVGESRGFGYGSDIGHAYSKEWRLDVDCERSRDEASSLSCTPSADPLLQLSTQSGEGFYAAFPDRYGYSSHPRAAKAGNSIDGPHPFARFRKILGAGRR